MSDMSVRARIISDLVQIYNRTKHMEQKIENEDYGISELDKPFKYPDYYNAEIIDMEDFRMEMLKKKDTESKWVILQLHGGGYLSPFSNIYRVMAGLYSESAGGADVLSVDYRVAPEYVYPTALNDAEKAYDYLIEQGYPADRIIFGGDSAGGGLSLALALRLKRLGKELPAGIVLMSPWGDVSAELPSYKDNFEKDPVFGNNRSKVIFENPYIGNADKTDPELSPIYGDFTGFPPMLIQVGTEEMLLSDSEVLAEKARTAGVKVRFTKYEGMFHVFQHSAMLMPESKEAWFEVRRFMNEII